MFSVVVARVEQETRVAHQVHWDYLFMCSYSGTAAVG